MLERVTPVAERALGALPVPVRTLDALHLAAALFGREYESRARARDYDRRMRAAAAALGLPPYDLEPRAPRP